MAQADLDIRLQLDGLPQQQMLALATGKGSCSHAQPVSMQAFSYTTTAALQPYSAGITYLAESRPAPDGEFAEVRYEPSLCGERDFGTTAKQHGQDLIYTDCEDNDSPRILRGWAGFLEVEDELRLAGTQNIDLGSATGHLCTGFNMLKKALINRDKQHIRDIACAMPLRYDGEYHVPPDGPPHAIALQRLTQRTRYTPGPERCPAPPECAGQTAAAAAARDRQIDFTRRESGTHHSST